MGCFLVSHSHGLFLFFFLTRVAYKSTNLTLSSSSPFVFGGGGRRPKEGSNGGNAFGDLISQHAPTRSEVEAVHDEAEPACASAMPNPIGWAQMR